MTANVKVQIAFADGAMAASPTWTDVSAYVDLSAGISPNRGRGRTATAAEPGRCSLTLNNDDGRFTWGNVSGAYGLGLGDQPQLRQPLRVSADFGSGYRAIWTGYVDEWAGGWDGGMRPVVRVTASDRVSRLQLVSLNDGAIMSEVLYDSPVAYYPLDEPAGSTSAGDRSGRQGPALAPQSVGAGAGTVDFGSGTSPDGVGTVAAFTPTSSSNGKSLTGSGAVASYSSFTVEAWVRAGAWAHDMAFCGMTSAATDGVVGPTALAYYSGTGNIAFQVNSYNYVLVSQTPATDEWCHFALTCDGSTMRGYYQGQQIGTGATTGSDDLIADLITIGSLGPSSLYAASSQLLTDGQIAHVAVYDSALSAARIAAHYEAGQASGSFSGDTADERFTRLCRLAGLPSALYASDATATTVLGAQPLGGIGLMDAILQVTDSERGVAYVDGSGVLTYLSSASITGLTSALTLDESDVDQDVTLTTNDAELVNDVTVTRANGATQRRADQASIDSIGQAATTVDTLLTTDAEAGALADLLLSQGLVVHPRTDDLTLDLRAKSSTIDCDVAVQLDTGSRVTVTGLPTGAPTSTLDVMVTGVAHSITHATWDLTLTVAPLQTLPAWVLEDTTFGVLGVTTRLAYSSATDELLAEAALWLDASAGEV